MTIKHATFRYAINSIQNYVKLAQLIEQWTGNPEVRGLSPRLSIKFSDTYKIRIDFLYYVRVSKILTNLIIAKNEQNKNLIKKCCPFCNVVLL